MGSRRGRGHPRSLGSRGAGADEQGRWGSGRSRGHPRNLGSRGAGAGEQGRWGAGGKGSTQEHRQKVSWCRGAGLSGGAGGSRVSPGSQGTGERVQVSKAVGVQEGEGSPQEPREKGEGADEQGRWGSRGPGVTPGAQGAGEQVQGSRVGGEQEGQGCAQISAQQDPGTCPFSEAQRGREVPPCSRISAPRPEHPAGLDWVAAEPAPPAQGLRVGAAEPPGPRECEAVRPGGEQCLAKALGPREKGGHSRKEGATGFHSGQQHVSAGP